MYSDNITMTRASDWGVAEILEYLGYFALFVMNVFNTHQIHWMSSSPDVLQAMKSVVALKELSSLTSPDTNMLSKELDSICSSLLIHSGLQALTAADTLHHSVFCRLYKQKSPKAAAERCRQWNGWNKSTLKRLIRDYPAASVLHAHTETTQAQISHELRMKKEQQIFSAWVRNVNVTELIII